MPYKNVDEVDQQIQRLEKQVDTGTMKLVDEKKALAEISSLRKQRKGFAGFDEAQKGIDDVKGQMTELKKTLDNPEAKALSQKYDEIHQELASIKAEQDKAYSSLSSLRDERSKLNEDQQKKYAGMREIRDQYHKARMAYRDYEQEQYRIRQEKQKAERDAYQKEKRRKIAEKKLEEASEPAYMDEILTAEGLIRYFDPSSPESAKSLRGPSGFAAEAQRSIDDSGIKGTKLSKKDENEDMYFMGTGGKKGKKSKKGTATGSPAPSTPTEGKFNLTMGVIEELAKVNVEPPMNQAGVPAAVDKLKQKRDAWKSEQDKKTKDVSIHSIIRNPKQTKFPANLNPTQNIEKAQKEIDRLEAEASELAQPPPPSSSRRTHDSAKKPSVNNQVVNGTSSANAELAQEKDAVADVSEELKKAEIEDKAEE